MKKTMFITSVIMVVVMAIALTTSSLAWFTARGAASVTTDTLTLTAKANASSGIQISDVSAGGPWAGSINFTDKAELMPLLPYQYSDAETTLLQALVAEKFITNEVDENLKYVNAQGSEAVAANYFASSEIYITNMAQGSGAKAVAITPSIVFKKDDAVYNPGGTNRSDPNLYVAVLCNKTSAFEADGSTTEGYSTSAADWEIVNIFNSKALASGKVKFGKEASAFVSEADSTKSYTELTIADLITTTATNTIDPITTDAESGEYRNFGEVVQFKVVAWYDGVSLVNANSGTALQFELTFTAAAVA
jgi:hypothetical protein